ncbi:MAG: YceD family protein [Chloroflexota bacterium]
MIAFNVAQLLKSVTGTIRRVEVNELDPDLAADLQTVSPTIGSLRLMRTSAGILVTGTLTHEVEAACSRCLETFVRTQTIEIDDEFVPVVDVDSGVGLPEPDDVDAFRLTPDHLLDLSEAIRQYAIVESPLQPLCEEGCKGLCSSCGANLNLGACDCQPESGVPSGKLGALLSERLREAGFQPEQE